MMHLLTKDASYLKIRVFENMHVRKCMSNNFCQHATFRDCRENTCVNEPAGTLLVTVTSANFSAPFLWSASDASASLPLKMGFSNFFLNSDTVPKSNLISLKFQVIQMYMKFGHKLKT